MDENRYIWIAKFGVLFLDFPASFLRDGWISDPNTRFPTDGFPASGTVSQAFLQSQDAFFDFIFLVKYKAQAHIIL